MDTRQDEYDATIRDERGGFVPIFYAKILGNTMAVVKLVNESSTNCSRCMARLYLIDRTR